jgi:predicted NBD/HSP70 family sugar kinase/biotin operon repressor
LSNRDIRATNARTVLAQCWEAEAVTGTELIASTGLTRATVHDVCQELRDLGWIEELPNQRAHGGYVKGRPARRYALSPRAGVVVGVDSGLHRVIATVADLRGEVLARHTRILDDDPAASYRQEAVSTTVLDALAAARVAAGVVLAVAVGVPAPVTADGRTIITSNPFWNRLNPDLGAYLTATRGWPAVVDNDANLASIAEGWIGAGRGERQFVTLLAGERLGAGVVADGRLLRGGRGAAGEMVWLDHVDGVGSAHGIAALSREWAADALRRPGVRSVLSTGDLTAERVFAAAEQGDPVGADVLQRLGERFARVCAAIGKAFDTDLVIIAGAVAAGCAPILDAIRERMPTLAEPALPRVAASQLGEAIVSVGAVRRAVLYVQENALDLVLPGRLTPLPA